MCAVFVIACASAVSLETFLRHFALANVDDTGLAVPGATVKITHVETSQSREAPTNSTGSYNFPNIPTGTYEVDVTLPGFQSFKSKGVVVQQNTAVRVDAKLSVGALQETVIVSGNAVDPPDRERRRPIADDERAAGKPADQRPGLSEPHDADARRGAALLGAGRRYQQPGTLDGRLGERSAAGADRLPRGRRRGDEPVVPDLQSYSPALESVESVSVVTNSFDAIRAWPAGPR